MTIRLRTRTVTHAPSRFPCTDCRMSHGGCALNYISRRTVCCETCDHQPEGN